MLFSIFDLVIKYMLSPVLFVIGAVIFILFGICGHSVVFSLIGVSIIISTLLWLAAPGGFKYILFAIGMFVLTIMIGICTP